MSAGTTTTLILKVHLSFLLTLSTVTQTLTTTLVYTQVTQSITTQVTLITLLRLKLKALTSPNTTNARVGVACTPEQLPADEEVEDENDGTPVDTDEGGRGGEDAEVVVTTPATKTTNGGKGADVATATPAASTTLADTGAEQIVPMAAAAMIAVAMLGTTLAVRKNVL